VGLFRAGLCYRLTVLCVKTRGFPHSSFPEFLRVNLQIWLRTNQGFFRKRMVFISQLINKFTAYTFVKCFLNAGLSGIRSVRYRNEQECRCRNRSGTGIRGPSPVPECRCRRHRPRCRCPALQIASNFSLHVYLPIFAVFLSVCLSAWRLSAAWLYLCLQVCVSVCLSVFCTIVHSL
jgi:hypothetical protein